MSVCVFECYSHKTQTILHLYFVLHWNTQMYTHFGLAEQKKQIYMVIMAVMLSAIRIPTTNLNHGSDSLVASY